MVDGEPGLGGLLRRQRDELEPVTECGPGCIDERTGHDELVRIGRIGFAAGDDLRAERMSMFR